MVGKIMICFCVSLLTISCVSDDKASDELTTTITVEVKTPSFEIDSPKDGEKVKNKFNLKISPVGFELMPKGEVKDGEGHFHVMVDQPCVTAGVVIPEGQGHIHVGDGSNVKELELSPGRHELCVQIGDGFHVATNIKKSITVYVE